MIAAVGNCTFHIDSTMGSFHCLSFPIAYSRDVMIPDTAQVMIIAGNLSTAQAGTSVIVDEITLSGDDNGIIETENNLSATLQQNFPNPSSQSSIIPLTLTHNSKVLVKIFDVQGRELKTIADEFMTAGIHSIKLSVDDLVKGVYYYRAMGDDFNLAKKFIVD